MPSNPEPSESIPSVGDLVGEVQSRGTNRSPSVRFVPAASLPRALTEIGSPPSGVYLLGELPSANETWVAVVGSRRALPASRREAFRLGKELAAAGVAVVSGLAVGVDTAALEGALAAGGRTGAVLGNGLPGIYPAANAGLAERMIAAGGFLLSELPLHAPPLPRHFPRRNRLVSALARAVVVLQAGLRSGSLITAGWALDQGREVLVVPGSTEGSHFEGSHQLIRAGAQLVCSSREVIEALSGQREAALPSDDARLEKAWAEGATSLDELLARTGLGPAAVLRAWLTFSVRTTEGEPMS